MKTLKTRLCLRQDTYENWMEYNPVLLNGELAIVRFGLNIVKIKVGDGERKFSDLPFVTC